MKHIYVAEFRYGTPNLVKVEVVKETPKTFQVGRSERIMGFVYVGNRILKSVDWFDNAVDAVAFLVSKAENCVEWREKKVEKAKSMLAELVELLEELAGKE